MPTNFPDNPTLDQVYTGPSGNQWVWDGVKWTPYGSGTTGGPFLPIAGGTMAGELLLASDPVATLDATTKEYTDAGDNTTKALANTKLPLAGGTVTGDVFGVTANAGDSSKRLATTEFVGAVSKSAIALPIGGMCVWPTSVAPTNFLLCNGAVYNITDAPQLAAVLGNTYGGTAGSTFAVPNVVNRMVVGAGGTYALAGTGGEASHVLSVAELASHAHGVTDPTHNHSINNPAHNHGLPDPGHAHSIADPAHAHAHNGSYGYGIGASAPPSPLVNTGASNTGGSGTGIGIYAAGTGVTIQAAAQSCSANAVGTGISIQANGSNTAHNNMPPYIAMNMIIRYQ